MRESVGTLGGEPLANNTSAGVSHSASSVPSAPLITAPLP